MNKLLLTMVLMLTCASMAMAQRFTDQLDRGLVAVPTGASGNSNSNVVTWRRLASEYYGVTYNLYKNGTLVAEGLTTTCYGDDNNAPATTTYQVAAVVNGVEQEKCAAVTPWSQFVYNFYGSRNVSAYLDIDLASVYDRNGQDVTANYEANDAEMADLDGDGQLEIIVKRLNVVDASAQQTGYLYPQSSTQFVVLDAYDVNWQTGEASLLWRIDCGPNMVSMNSTEINIIAYDWDEDGKAEVVLRGADNMIVYGSDGKTQLYTIGDMSVNTRSTFGTANQQYAWTHTGAEYLIYMNGETGALYQKTDFPLKRLESGESSLNKAWGDDYGHRSSKYFMGAPFLDGRKASLFLGRGIYTRHKMIAMDLNRSSHQWTTRWTWSNNSSSSPWYGNGYHNYIVADVDEDGRDEIVYGSMVIDDNGKGLSTTGLGHGDAQHVGDFDPYRKGLEFFGCLEDNPGNNYRNATTSEIYYRKYAAEDDGRALMANFSNDYPGSQGRSVSSGMVASLRNDTEISELSGDSFIEWGKLNFRIYYDGDLCSEILDSPGEGKEAMVLKPGGPRLLTSEYCNMNNGSKNNPCFQGDIIGDWREEIVVRRGLGLRVYTTGIWTAYSLPSLWFDHQYRQAMVWQMMGYNQPPHLSYFLGDMEGFTVAPPPLTTDGRVEISNGGTIGTSHNNKHVLLCDASSVGIAAAGVSPQVITVVVNAIVSGNNNGNIATTYNATQLGDNNGKGDITGDARLVKQGDGLLKLTARNFSYTGNTDIWGGTLRYRGTFSGSNVWMNRHTSFFSGATIAKSLTMEYGAKLYPTEGDVSDASTVSYGTTSIGTLNLHEGARIVLQIDPQNSKSDQVNIGTLTIRTRSGEAWENYGPEYLKPVIEIQSTSALQQNATYTLGRLDAVEGNLEDIIVEGAGADYQLLQDNGYLKLMLSNERVSAPTVEGEGKVKTVTAGTSSLGNDVEVWYTTTASNSPKTDGTRLDKPYIKMPNETTYYFYSVSSSGIASSATVVTFDGVVTETYPFQQWVQEGYTNINCPYTSSNLAFNFYEDHYYALDVNNGSASHTLNKRFGMKIGTNYFWMRNNGNGNAYTGLFCNKNNDRIIGITNLNPGDKFNITLANGNLYFRNSKVYKEGDTSKTPVAYGATNEEGTALESGVTYVVADDAGSNCYVLLGTNKTYASIKLVTVKIPAVDETVSEPVVKVTAAYEGMRTVSITPGVGSQGTAATETYYTLDGSDPTVSNSKMLYTEPFVISQTTTVKAVSYIVDDASSVASAEVEAGTTLKLNAPTYAKTAYADGAFTVVIGSNQSSLVAAPQSVGYFYTIDGGEITRGYEGQQLRVFGGSTLSVFATAEGYADSDESQLQLGVMPVTTDNWSIDFTTIPGTSYSEESIGGYMLLINSTTGQVLNENFGVQGDGTNGNQAYIHNGGLYMGFSGGRNLAFNVAEGQYVRIVMNGGVNSTAGMTYRQDLSYGNVHLFQVTNTGVCTVNIPRYTVIYSVAVLDVVSYITKTISSAGWATYCSPYALDFSQPIDNLTSAYYVTGAQANGTTLTLLEVNGIVPGGTGILLKGQGECQIPVLSGSGASTEGNLLVGVLESTVKEPNTVYVLMKENGVVGFYSNNNAFTVGAQTAYLPIGFDGSGSLTAARGYAFSDDSAPTAIGTITLPQVSDRFFNMNGQRVSAPQKGVYIVDGKKIIIK